MISKLTLVVISVLIFGLIVTSTVQAATTVTASVAYANHTEEDEMYIDSGMNVSGDSIYESARIYIKKGYVRGEDYLNFTDSNGITGYFNESNGLLTLSGSGDAAAYRTAFRNVRYVNTNSKPDPGTREILYILGNTTPYFPEKQHYYESVSTSSPISWNDAKYAAENRSYDGLQGYLVTITSPEENEFIAPKVSENTWIGASDKDSEGQWNWVTGPEAGTLFYNGNYPGNETGYNNWITGKPNGYSDGKDLNEDYALICGKSCGKKWNDRPDENYISSYLVEYGGIPGETLPQLMATVSINVPIFPYADFDANLTIGIEPFSVAFTDLSQSANSWHWDFGDGNTSKEQNPTHVFNSGTFTVNLTATNNNGSSSKILTIDVLKEPELTVNPNGTEKISLYGDEVNFSVSSNLLSNFEWFIDGKNLNGTGVRYCTDNNNSGLISCCTINSSQYINQADFFVETYNVSVLVRNESTGRTDTFAWEWIVTDSSAENAEDICFVVVKEADLTKTDNQTIAGFNTTENTRTDDNNLAGSLTAVSFDAPDNATDLLLKFEVISKYAMNTSGTTFSVASVYQHMDIRVNNKTLVNENENRFIEFRVLKTLEGGVLNVTSIQLKHRDNSKWETYTPEFLKDDETYSYYIVHNVSSFSPFAVTATYDHSPETETIDEGMPAYLKKEWLKAKNKDNTAQPYEESSKGLDAPTIKGELVSGEENNMGFESDMNDPNRTNIGKMVLTAVAMIITILLSIIVLMTKMKE